MNILFLYPDKNSTVCDSIDPMMTGTIRYNFHWIKKIYEDCKQEPWLQKHTLFFNELDSTEKLDFIYYHKYCNPDSILLLKKKYKCKLVYCFLEHPDIDLFPAQNIEIADIHVHLCQKSKEVFQYGKPTFIVGEYEYMPYYDSAKVKKHKKITILWFGYLANLQALEQTGLDVILKDLLKKHDFNIKFISNFSSRTLFLCKARLPNTITNFIYDLLERPHFPLFSLDFPKRKILYVRWDPSTFVREAKKCHLSIVPIRKTRNKFDAQVKSANRVRSAMACRLPVVADFSDGEYIVEDYLRTANDTEGHEDGTNFLLCSNRDEWYNNIDFLLSNVQEREKLANRGYLATKNKFNVRESLRTLLNKLQEHL